MRLHVLHREQLLPGSPEQVFPFFGDARNLERITPPFLGFRVITPEPIQMHAGTLIAYKLRLHGVPVRWLTRIAVWEPPERFVDVQIRGPYSVWHHTHTFEAAGPNTLMRDVVRYGLPLGTLGEIAHRLFVKRDVEGIFDYRREVTPALFGTPEVGASLSKVD